MKNLYHFFFLIIGLFSLNISLTAQSNNEKVLAEIKALSNNNPTIEKQAILKMEYLAKKGIRVTTVAEEKENQKRIVEIKKINKVETIQENIIENKVELKSLKTSFMSTKKLVNSLK